MASSSSYVRKAIRGLEEGLSLFTSQLATETHELRRNVENQPCTGPTYYRNILEDLHQRLEGIGQELLALEGVCGVDAISLEVPPPASPCLLAQLRADLDSTPEFASMPRSTCTGQP